MKRIKLNLFRPDRRGVRRFLGDLEADILELLWKNNPSSVHDIHKILCKKRDLAYTTVMTVMTRLADKGLLSKEKEGKQFIYSPAVTRTELSGSFIRSALSDLGTDLSLPALAYFVEGMSKEDDSLLSELESLIHNKRKEMDGDINESI